MLSAQKIATLLTDNDLNNVPSPGDVLRYQVTIANSGNGAATGVVFTDLPDNVTTLVSGSVTTTQGAITSGNAGTPPVRGRPWHRRGKYLGDHHIRRHHQPAPPRGDEAFRIRAPWRVTS